MSNPARRGAILLYYRNHEKVTVRDLCKFFGMNLSTASEWQYRLTRDGYLNAIPYGSTKRKSRYTLTDKGRSYVNV